MGPVDVHLERLKARHSHARALEVNGTGTLISLPSVELPAGWNKSATEVHFFAPVGYPYAKPDCFWADSDLRLGTGAMPQASNLGTPMTGLGKEAIWFSWHTDHWSPGRDDLSTWLATIRHRFANPV